MGRRPEVTASPRTRDRGAAPLSRRHDGGAAPGKDRPTVYRRYLPPSVSVTSIGVYSPSTVMPSSFSSESASSM